MDGTPTTEQPSGALLIVLGCALSLFWLLLSLASGALGSVPALGAPHAITQQPSENGALVRARGCGKDPRKVLVNLTDLVRLEVTLVISW